MRATGRGRTAGNAAERSDHAVVIRSFPGLARAACVAALGLLVANCAQQKADSRGGVDPKYGVRASPRVVGENDPVPKGGGRNLVGKPYVVAGKTYVPSENPSYVREGIASWYGPAFHGRLTANGEVFDRYSIAAAHPTLPLPSYARITNLQNDRSMIVRVNDRGPYHGKRILDVSQRAAEALEFKHMGVARVRVEYLGRASTRGSDDRKLLATLRTDGRPAAFPGASATMVADAGEAAAPPRALAYREAPPASPEAETRPVVVAGAATLVGQPLVNVPIPPERPFDLGTIPNAATPVPGPVAQLAPPRRPAYAGLFYADPSEPRTRFAKADPLAGLAPQNFVPLRN